MQTSLPLAIIQLETPPENVMAVVGEQHHWFVSALALQPEDYVVIRPDLGDALPAPETISAAILSGSWAMVTDHADWSERTAAWIRGAVEQSLPLLGVCYGHQLMAYALGGEVGDNPQGWERGLQQLETLPGAEKDPLLAAFPAHFPAWLSHRQTVRSAPEGATVLARSALDDCQIIRYSDTALSLQFHPEFTGGIMNACLQNHTQDAQVVSLLTHQAEPRWPRQLLADFWQQSGLASQRA